MEDRKNTNLPYGIVAKTLDFIRFGACSGMQRWRH